MGNGFLFGFRRFRYFKLFHVLQAYCFLYGPDHQLLNLIFNKWRYHLII